MTEDRIKHPVKIERANPLVEPDAIRGVPERVDYKGAIIRELDEAATEAALRQLIDVKCVEALAVCFLWSFYNPAHELAACADEDGGLSERRILPRMDEWRIAARVATAVGLKAQDEGLARRAKDRVTFYREACATIEQARETVALLMRGGAIAPRPFLPNKLGVMWPSPGRRGSIRRSREVLSALMQVKALGLAPA